ncbi:MAG: hypothetical protein E6K76_11500 [Candidatus Eisenbacteria bacterium]|uniref:DUF1440 domain-containing protein n=1 Tax=Eiseniibacteriota bacterium TaxID=2212470 RepID=A0A538T0L2_UNCEI|nr:MAG: hypothetical protein E6K76_11500 [Candidatus Eisenbacteria bacterium]
MSEAKKRASKPRSVLRSIAAAWLVAGTLDILVAIVYYGVTVGVPATRILQGIASGILGVRAFHEGPASAALGLACHYTIALLWTLFFFVVYPRIGRVTERKWATAVLYGIFVSLVMNLAVVPLSNVPSRPFSLSHLVVATVILIFTIGLPLTIIVGRYYDGHLHAP